MGGPARVYMGGQRLHQVPQESVALIDVVLVACPDAGCDADSTHACKALTWARGFTCVARGPRQQARNATTFGSPVRLGETPLE